MVRLTCLVRRKPGMSPEEFHRHWREVHGPLIAGSGHGQYVVRYEQHHRALSDYPEVDDGGYDGVTVQWFESMDAYRESLATGDFPEVWKDLESFLDVERIVYVLTDEDEMVVIKEG